MVRDLSAFELDWTLQDGYSQGVKLTHGAHLAYCTNVHHGRDWAETLASLERHALAVRDRVCQSRSFAIGLRLSDTASRELSVPAVLAEFQRWLRQNNCYVFTINGFPYGNFHGTRVKEQVAQPDWTSPDRLRYTLRLFDILVQLVPSGVEGSVSTVPVSFKQFGLNAAQAAQARDHLWQCVEHLDQLRQQTGIELHLGLEPEPFGTVENTAEFLGWMERLGADRPSDPRLLRHLGINYDTCHFALQYEDPAESLGALHRAGIKISKIHLSNALRVRPIAAVLSALEKFLDGVYFHQVIAREPDGQLTRHRDLEDALTAAARGEVDPRGEWRIHFHVPLHAPESAEWGTTSQHLLGTLAVLGSDPSRCRHLEMETYTWEVLPETWRQGTVEDMLAAEYAWTLDHLAPHGFVALPETSV